MPIPLAIPLLGAAAQGILGASQYAKSQKALKDLEGQPVPEYSQGPELTQAYQQAQAMSQRGYMSEEKAAFQQQLARTQTGQSRSALDMTGGQMGGAINSVLQANQTGAINQFAADDAGLRRENIRHAGGLAQAVQQQQNLQQQNKIQRRNMLESAYGQSSATGQENIVNAFTGAASTAMSMYGGRQGSGVPGKNAGGFNFPNQMNK